MPIRCSAPAILCLLASFTGFGAAMAAAEPQALDIRPYEASAVCGAHVPQVQVIVEGVTGQGILTVELYRPSERDFLKKASRIHRIRVPAQPGTQRVCFDIEKAGEYAIAAYEDLDADRDLDQKWNMMPAEPFALSNDKPLAFAMPKFSDAAFRVTEKGGVVRIRLQK